MMTEKVKKAAATLCLAQCLLWIAGCMPGAKVDFPSARLSSGAFHQPELSGFISKPEGDGPFPAVVLLHGCGGIRPREAGWREWFNSRDFVALSVDSFGPRGVSNICSNPGLVDVTARIADAFGSLDYLAKQPFVDRDRIAVMGFSNGGIVALSVAGPPSWIARSSGSPSFGAAIAFYPECLAHMPPEYPPPSIPLLILIGSADDWTLASSCQRMVDEYKGSRVTLVVLPGARHGFDDANQPFTTSATVVNINSSSGTGATVAGDAKAAAQSEQEVDHFLRIAFAASRPPVRP